MCQLMNLIALLKVYTKKLKGETREEEKHS